MKNLFFLLCLAVFLSACGTNPADTELKKISLDPTNDAAPIVQMLESVEISHAETLVLKKVEVESNQSRTPRQSVWERCDELGTLDNAVYNKIPLQGNQTPCFKNVHFWQPGMIFGQYSPSDSSPDVWFITDSNGKVHHLPKAPKKDRGFKNDKIIRKYKGKPVYLTQEDFLTGFDMSSDEEEIVIESRVGRYVILPKNNGDHIVYTDLVGGKIKRPDGSVDEILYVDLSGSFYKNPGNDIGYTSSLGFLNIIFDATGDILEKQASAVPVELQEYFDGPIESGSVPPKGPTRPAWGLTDCERDENFILCGDRGFMLADSSQDIKEIDWYELGVSGANPEACLTDNFIYYAAGETLHKINKDLSASEEILTDFSVYTLQCLNDDNLIIHGLNAANSQYETFQLNGNIRTMITEDIAQFIR